MSSLSMATVLCACNWPGASASQPVRPAAATPRYNADFILIDRSLRIIADFPTRLEQREARTPASFAIISAYNLSGGRPRWPPPHYFASGFGRTCSLKTLGCSPLPPSLWKTVRVPDVVHRPLPFQPALGSSTRPSTSLVLKPSGYGTRRSTILPSTTASSDSAPLAEAIGTFAPSPRVL